MVNAKKVEKKLPNLLIDGETTDPANWNAYLKKRQRLTTFKRNHPTEYNNLRNRAVKVLEEIDKVLIDDLVYVDKVLTEGVRKAFSKKKR